MVNHETDLFSGQTYRLDLFWNGTCYDQVRSIFLVLALLIWEEIAEDKKRLHKTILILEEPWTSLSILEVIP